MVRRQDNDFDHARALLALVVIGTLTGVFAAVGDFVSARAPLFVALALALGVLTVLVVRRRLATARAEEAHQRWLDQHVATTDGMTGRQFEQLVARLLRRDGYRDVSVPGGSGDLGADVLATAPDGSRVVIQCKRYSQHRSVSSPEIQKFLGTCFHEHGADHAWFVTTTHFSGPARELGERRHLHLIDRAALAEWMAADPLNEATSP